MSNNENDDNELRTIEVDNLTTVYADGPATAMVVGPNLRITFYVIRIWCGEPVRYPVLEIVLPDAAAHTLDDVIRRGREKARTITRRYGADHVVN